MPPKRNQSGSERMPAGVTPEEYWSVGLEPYNPDDVAGSKGLKIYREMRRREPVIAQGLKHIEYSRLAKGDRIDPGEGERAEEMAEFVRFVFAQMEGTKKDLIHNMLDAMPMGFAVIEKVPVEYDGGAWGGRWGFQRFSAKWQESIDFLIDPHGNLIGMKHKGGFNQQAFTAEEMDRFIVYVPNREKGNWYGESMLRPAYRSYVIKDHLTRYLAAHMEKFGGGTGVRKVGASVDPGKMQEIQDDGEKHSGAMWYTIEADGELELLYPPSGVGEGLTKAIEHCNSEMLKAIGIPQTMFSGTGDSGAGGSLALSQTHADNFGQVIDRIGRSLEDTIDEQVIRYLIEWNWPNAQPEEYPVFRFEAYAEEDGLQKLERLKVGKDLGVDLLKSDVYEAVGVEEPPEDADEDDILTGKGGGEIPAALQQNAQPAQPDQTPAFRESAAKFSEAIESEQGYLDRFGEAHFKEINDGVEGFVSAAVKELTAAANEIHDKAREVIDGTA